MCSKGLIFVFLVASSVSLSYSKSAPMEEHLSNTDTEVDLAEDIMTEDEVLEIPERQRKNEVEPVGLNGDATKTRRTSGGYDGYTKATTGSVYIRWGRKRCAGDAVLVYEGVIGGGHYTSSGSGGNFQCLPLNPIFAGIDIGTGGYRATMYGTEYETNTFSPLSSVHDHDAVCAVCHVRSRGSALMIPARNKCPSGWSREYHGYLMGAYHGHARSEFICVDLRPEGRMGSSTNKNGALLYPVEGRCGSLPCHPYVQGNELTCAVCSI